MAALVEALQRLREGNRRVVTEVRSHGSLGQTRRCAVADAQEPFATNVRISANQLRHGSVVLEQLIQNDGLLVGGAEYSLVTGVVDFFDGVPAVPFLPHA